MGHNQTLRISKKLFALIIKINPALAGKTSLYVDSCLSAVHNFPQGGEGADMQLVLWHQAEVLTVCIEPLHTMPEKFQADATNTE